MVYCTVTYFTAEWLKVYVESDDNVLHFCLNLEVSASKVELVYMYTESLLECSSLVYKS